MKEYDFNYIHCLEKGTGQKKIKEHMKSSHKNGKYSGPLNSNEQFLMGIVNNNAK